MASFSPETLINDRSLRFGMRVVLWGTCDTGKPRVRILRDGLRANGVEVIECRVDIWHRIQDKSELHGFRRWAGLLLSILIAYPGLVWRYMKLPKHDWVLLGYPAIPDIFVIRFFAWLRKADVAMDWFLSAYDTVILDRKLTQPWGPLAWALRATEWIATRLPDRLFMDTQAHARRMERLFSLPPGSCRSVWVGVEDHVFQAQKAQTKARDPKSPLQVLFYGQFIPLHGVPTIVEAARLLEEEPVEWLLIGSGQEAPKVESMLEASPLPKLRWIKWVDYESLFKYIEKSDVCLGIFGISEKAASVIPNKVFQALFAGKPIITRDSPAIRELFGPKELPNVTVPAGDPKALANSILRHISDKNISPIPITSFRKFTAPEIGLQLLEVLSHESCQL